MQRRTFLAGAAAALGFSSSLLADDKPDAVEYGHLRGRFVYDGEPPKPIVFFAKGGLIGPLVDEGLVVKGKNNGIANVAVSLYLKRGEMLPTIHPDYEMHVIKADVPRRKTLTVMGSRFEPHLLLLRSDEELIVTNADVDGCALKIDAVAGLPMAFLLPAGAIRKVGVLKEERLPAPVRCAIHPWMSSRLVVKNHPYMAVSDADGRFEIRNIPVGERVFQFWHERAGYMSQVKRGGVLQSWKAGRPTMTIPADETLDLGDIEVSAERF